MARRLPYRRAFLPHRLAQGLVAAKDVQRMVVELVKGATLPSFVMLRWLHVADHPEVGIGVKA